MSKTIETPYACIRATPGGAHTLCSRFPEKSEFVFEDAEHAADFYVGARHLKVCVVCVEEHHKKKKTAEASGAATGGAVRGVNDR